MIESEGTWKACPRDHLCDPQATALGSTATSGTGLGKGVCGECFLWIASPRLSFKFSGHISATYSDTSSALVCSLCTPNPVSGCFSTAQTSLHSTVLVPTVDVGHLELHPIWSTSSTEEFPRLCLFLSFSWRKKIYVVFPS